MSDGIEALRVGEKVAEGHFRVDSKKALERLRQNRLANPAHWIRDVLRAAQGAGARTVHVTAKRDRVEVSFDASFPATLSKNLLARALGEGAEAAPPHHRLLALGFAGAMGLHPKHLHFHSSTVAIDVDAKGELSVRSAAPAAQTVLKLRKSFGLKVAASWLLTESPEAHACRDGTERYRPVLKVNGKSVPTAPALTRRGSASAELTLLADPLPTAEGLSDVELIVFGVRAGRRRLQVPGLQMRAAVVCDALRLNASGSDVVDDDPALQAAQVQLARLSLDFLRESIHDPPDALRMRLGDRLLLEADELHAEARQLLRQMPLFPGPSGERISVQELAERAQKGKPLYVATRTYALGSYPLPTVLLDRETKRWEQLLPSVKRVDVGPLVRRRLKAAENRDWWLSLPVEEVKLPDQAWLGTASISTAKLEGHVGVEPRGVGAFIRLLNHGRLLQQGEVPALAPLRLSAVLNLTHDLKQSVWAELPNPKLWNNVVGDVRRAAMDAIAQAVSAHPDNPEALAHALDVLRATAHQSDSSVPDAIFAARVFPLVGGGRTSLGALKALKRWQFTTGMAQNPLLDGSAVLATDASTLKLLKRYGDKKLVNVADKLERDSAVLKRLAGPRAEPKVRLCVVAHPFAGAQVRGEVGVSRDPGEKMLVALYREGFLLETVRSPARYGPTVAAVEFPGLTPAADWSKAKRDDAFQLAMAAVAANEKGLALRLLEKHATFSELPESARRWLIGFARKEVHGVENPGPEAVALLQARLWEGSEGRVSALDIQKLGADGGHFWLLARAQARAALKGLPVVVGDESAGELVALCTGLKPRDAEIELQRIDERTRFYAQPKPPLPQLPLAIEFQVDGFVAHAGLGPHPDPTARVALFLDGRPWREDTVPNSFPLSVRVLLTGFDATLELAQAKGLSAHAVATARRLLVESALAQLPAATVASLLTSPGFQTELPATPEMKLAREAAAVLWATLGARAERELPEEMREELLLRPLYPCLDGPPQSARQLSGLSEVLYVRARVVREPSEGPPVVLALDPFVESSLQRFRHTADVTARLENEHALRTQLAGAPAETEITIADRPLLSIAAQAPFVGEVGLSPTHRGRLELFWEMRPMETVSRALPEPFTAALNSDALNPGGTGVLRDAAFSAAVKYVIKQRERLAQALAEQWPHLQSRHEALEAAVKLCAALCQGRRHAPAHPLLQIPLVPTTSGSALPFAALWEERRRHGAVWVSSVDGHWPAATRPVFRLDGPWKLWLEPLGLPTQDVSAEIRRAQEVASRPRVAKVKVPVNDAAWKARVSSRGFDGEVALANSPQDTLQVELYRENSLVERFERRHPFGAVAAVNCDLFATNPSFTRVSRDAIFKSAMATVDGSLADLLAQRLAAEPPSREWAEAAATWATEYGGQVAQALHPLRLFTRLDGEPVSVGAVLAESSRTGRVAVAQAGLQAGQVLVLQDTEEARALLQCLAVTVKDVSSELRRRDELEHSRRSRRLQELAWSGEALVRAKVDLKSPRVMGELALPANDSNVELVLAKQGVRVEGLPASRAPQVAGVLDFEELTVNEAWDRAELNREERDAITAAVDTLWSELCEAAPKLSTAHKAVARAHVLRWLAHCGVRGTAQFDTLTGVEERLTRLPLFETLSGSWVPLTTLADEVSRRQTIPVFADGLLRPEVPGFCLVARRLDEGWLEALEHVLGKRTLKRVQDARAYLSELKEADPLPSSPELWGLNRLRREARLLRAGALGALTPNELYDVWLKALGGAAVVHYDAKRAVALLDSEHPLVTQALAEAKLRPERLYVLLAAIYGAINRALDRVTDEHEMALSAALAVHLAANPHLLESGQGQSASG